jgi:hypothetical protein
MTPETFTSLVNLGSAGAVIAVVIIFLRSIKERDAEWRNFFTELNKNNKDDVCQLAETMERMVNSLDAHDRQAKMIADNVKVVLDVITKPKTQPRRRPQAQP